MSETELCPFDIFFAECIMQRFQLSDESIKDRLIQLMNGARMGDVCTTLDQSLPDKLLESGAFVEHEKQTYFQRNWILETHLIDPLLKLFDGAVEEGLQVPSDLLHSLNTEQQQAVKQSLTSKLFILSGGPGTGKTFTARRIIEAHIATSDKPLRIALAAPTGKAVSKLKQSLEGVKDALPITASTLHTLLGIKRSSDFLKKPKCLSFDVILIDECSMIDMALWTVLLRSLLPHTKLILLGDVHQLPSVEPGHVFEDLWKVVQNKRKTCGVELKQSMRTESMALLTLANKVKLGESDSSVIFAQLPSEDTLIQAISPQFTEVLKHEIDQKVLVENQILCGLRQGPFGVDRLNAKIFNHITLACKPGDRLAIPILLTRNAPDLDLCNGQMGIWVHQVHPETQKHLPHPKDYVLFDERDPLPFSLLPPHELAYAISVHKSQGSEYDRVHFLMPPGSERFGRKMLYTAITRARQQLIIYGSTETYHQSIAFSGHRTSGLANRLLKLLK
ncbi:MAG: exodeoxyribonuclease V subunit alpha [Chlamydiales bacterium]|nr:exodeoxyribonuclease V subunit alpha [Chlamydiales bacterium]